MDTLTLVDPDHDESFEHFVSLLGIEPRLSGTFSAGPKTSLQEAWDAWRQSLFLPLLAPSFLQAYDCGIRARTQELQEIDQNLDEKLPSSIRKRSVKAAAPFFEGKSQMQGNREWLKYQERVENGDTPGHLAIAFALQSALYHVALIPALSSYAWFEFRSREGKGISAAPTEEEVRIFAAILPDVSVALSGERDDSTGGEHSLRVL